MNHVHVVVVKNINNVVESNCSSEQFFFIRYESFTFDFIKVKGCEFTF